MDALISIVVPVYKVEKYLKKCVESLINQTYKAIEIILVNDGSPDLCPKLCDEYAVKDKRISVIHKENGGLSDARNTGLREAKGEYVLFVDSDDFIDLNTCERFEKFIGPNKPDIIVGNARKIDGNQVVTMSHTFNSYGKMITGKQYLKNELSSGTMYMAVCLNLYNKSYLLVNQFKFKVGILHEDEQFTPRVFLKAERIIGTDIIFYNYLIRENSITTSVNKIKNAEHLLQTCKELERIYINIEDKDLSKLLNDNLVNKFLNIFQEAELHKKEHIHLVDDNFLEGKALTKRNKLRVTLFLMNKKVYFYVNKIFKIIKRC